MQHICDKKRGWIPSKQWMKGRKIGERRFKPLIEGLRWGGDASGPLRRRWRRLWLPPTVGPRWAAPVWICRHEGIPGFICHPLASIATHGKAGITFWLQLQHLDSWVRSSDLSQLAPPTQRIAKTTLPECFPDVSPLGRPSAPTLTGSH